METTEMKFVLKEISVLANISINSDFKNCNEILNNPFSNSITILPENLNIENYEKVVVQCKINEDELVKILLANHIPQTICVEIIEQFAEKKWNKNETILYKTMTCNESESQFQYLIKK